MAAEHSTSVCCNIYESLRAVTLRLLLRLPKGGEIIYYILKDSTELYTATEDCYSNKCVQEISCRGKIQVFLSRFYQKRAL